MSTIRPGQTLLSRCLSRHAAASRAASPATAAPTPLAATCHRLHTSAPRPARRPRFKSIKAEQMGLTTPEKVDEYANRKFPDYDEPQIEGLKEMYEYTEGQIEAVQAGETAVSPRDMALQGRVRDDKARLSYLEDFSEVKPVLDLKPERRLEAKNYKWLSEQEFQDKLFEKMLDKTTANMEEAAAAAFRRSVERVAATNGLEVDLTTKEFEGMETWPELKEKYLMTPEQEEMSNTKLKAKDEANMKDALVSGKEMRRMLEELVDDFANSLGGKVNEETSELFAEDERLDVNTSGTAPPLGKVPGVEGLYKHANDPEDEGLDEDGRYQDLKKVTGMTVRDLSSIYTKPLVVRFVTNQTRLGKVRSSSIMVIAGNGNGRLGVGMAKSAEHGTAINAARMLALRNMKPIRRYENRTIYGTVKVKLSGTVVELRARPPGMFFPFFNPLTPNLLSYNLANHILSPGFGLRVPSRLFEMCRAAGIHDLSAIIPRSKNPMNTVKATYQALTNQPDPEAIAEGRGKKLVDVRKVYYGGAVH